MACPLGNPSPFPDERPLPKRSFNAASTIGIGTMVKKKGQRVMDPAAKAGGLR